MVSSLLDGAKALKFSTSIAPSGLGLKGSNFHAQHCSFPYKISHKAKILTPRCSSSSISSSRPASQPRFIQHKKEAFWFYRFLSIVYDHVINPGHWTEDMRDEALEPADLYDRKMTMVDVGGGTGFTTLGIVKHVDAKNVTILDQFLQQILFNPRYKFSFSLIIHQTSFSHYPLSICNKTFHIIFTLNSIMILNSIKSPPGPSCLFH